MMNFLLLPSDIQATILRYCDINELSILFQHVSQQTSDALRTLNEQVDYEFQYIVPRMSLLFDERQAPPEFLSIQWSNTLLNRPSEMKSIENKLVKVEHELLSQPRNYNLYQQSKWMCFRRYSLGSVPLSPPMFTISFDRTLLSQLDQNRGLLILFSDTLPGDFKIDILHDEPEYYVVTITFSSLFFSSLQTEEKQQLFLLLLEYLYNHDCFSITTEIPEEWNMIFKNQSKYNRISDQYLEFLVHMLTCKNDDGTFCCSDDQFEAIVVYNRPVDSETPQYYSRDIDMKDSLSYLSGTYNSHVNNVYFVIFEQFDLHNHSDTVSKQVLLDRFINCVWGNEHYKHYIGNVPDQYQEYCHGYKAPYWTVDESTNIITYHCFSFRIGSDRKKVLIAKELTCNFPGYTTAENVLKEQVNPIRDILTLKCLSCEYCYDILKGSNCLYGCLFCGCLGYFCGCLLCSPCIYFGHRCCQEESDDLEELYVVQLITNLACGFGAVIKNLRSIRWISRSRTLDVY
jgi:hypothetical protein